MPLSRMELDEKGCGSPEGLVTRILKLAPELKPAIPITNICQRLDIVEIKELRTESFEGQLLTDAEKSRGIIVVRKAHPYRQRFTIAHELGHFLIPTHKPSANGSFMCSQADMQQLGAKEQDSRKRMEAEANRFASLILIPPPFLRQQPQMRGDPNLGHIPGLSDVFETSKDATARAYAQYHPENIAIIVSRHGQFQRAYRDERRFPFVEVGTGKEMPRGCLLARGAHPLHAPSDIVEGDAALWIHIERGRRAPTLYEQVYCQQEGYALTLLWLEVDEDEEFDKDDNLTSKQRYQDRMMARVR